MGIDGEPGVSRGPIRPADEVADELLQRIMTDLQPTRGSELAVLVNGLGSTPKEELYILYRRIHAHLAEHGHRVHRLYLGEFATSLEMAGASISVLELDDRAERLDRRPGRLAVL